MIWWQELIGYLGMIFIVVSFLMKKVTLLRFLNVIGGALSCIYGLLTKTYPTMALNLILVCINFSFPVRYYIHAKKEDKDNNLTE